MASRNVRIGWVTALCCAMTWMGGCGGPTPPISLLEDDAGPRIDAPVGSRPDAATLPGECDDGCFVAGVCYRAGAVNPENPCAICRPSADADGFSPNDGATCDDGQFCTTRDFCSGRTCVGTTPRVCDDGVACTAADRCNEALDSCEPGPSSCAAGDVCDVTSGECADTCAFGCAIAGVCFPNGARNPTNDCQVCNTTYSSTAWTNADGRVCDDGLFCTVGDTCSAGACSGAGRECGDGVACNGDETCSETANSCVPGPGACGADEICNPVRDVCQSTCSGCAIGGTCFAPSEINPTNPCEICDPARSPSAWSANDGSLCDDGAYCTVSDVCSAGRCGGVARSCDDGIACTGTEFCDESVDSCAPGAVTCTGGDLCDLGTGSCASSCTGCAISGVCVPADTVNPLNRCEICDVARSRTAFSPNDGASCDDGEFCTTGDTCGSGVCTGSTPRGCSDGAACNGEEVCDETLDRCEPGVPLCAADLECDPSVGECVACTGCLIDGVCHADGASDPSNSCQACDVASSATAWTARDGIACDDGDLCTESDVCSAGVCAGAATSCGDGVACNGAETCDVATGLCVAGADTCAMGELCDIGIDSCVSACPGGCAIDGVCYADGDVDPLNPCRECDAAQPSSWSFRDGASCDDGFACTTGDVCAAGACGGTTVTCGDGVACNGAEACDPGTGLCAAAASTCLEGEACDPALDTCNADCGGGCAFDATCYPSGASHPDSACVVCVGSAWSNADGLACDDGAACTTADVCSAGVCAGAALVCNDGVACNGVEFCDAGTGACVLGASLCAAGEYCDLDAGVCTAEPCAGCEIAGICYPNDTPNPANACAVCHVGTSRETWTDVSGVACDDGSSCTTGDTCWFGSCEGTPVVCDDAVACNGVETCSEVTGLCVDGTTTCTGELMCDVATDACVPAPCAGCEIGGICYLDGAQDPTNPCAICEVSSSRTDWSAGSGLACDDGDPCTSSDVCAAGSCIGAPVVCDDGVACNGTETCAPETGLCVDGATTCASDLVCDEIVDECVCAGCLIDSTCYADGAVDHSDACQVCDVATSTTAWSVVPACP